jgi:hypothetical protein
MMNENGQQDHSQDIVPVPEEGTDQSRRKFTRAGLIAAPVIMTLASRPALGYYNCTLSGLLSGNLSNPNTGTCFGKSPGFWKGGNFFSEGKKATRTQYGSAYSKENWPSPVLPTTLFHSIFAGSNFGGATLIQLMDMDGSQDPHQMGFQTVGAYLNGLEAWGLQRFDLNQENWGMSPDTVITLYNNNYGNPAALAALFDAWNHAGDRAGTVQTLFGP